MTSSLESLSHRVRATRCATVSPTPRRRRRARLRQHHHPVEQIEQNGSIRTSFRAEEEPPRERVRHRSAGANGHRTTNLATRRTTAKQSNAQEQTGWFGNSQRKRGPDGFFGLFRAKRPRAGSEDEQDDTRNHGTQVRVRINGAERQVRAIPLRRRKRLLQKRNAEKERENTPHIDVIYIYIAPLLARENFHPRL